MGIKTHHGKGSSHAHRPLAHPCHRYLSLISDTYLPTALHHSQPRARLLLRHQLEANRLDQCRNVRSRRSLARMHNKHFRFQLWLLPALLHRRTFRAPLQQRPLPLSAAQAAGVHYRNLHPFRLCKIHHLARSAPMKLIRRREHDRDRRV